MRFESIGPKSLREGGRGTWPNRRTLPSSKCSTISETEVCETILRTFQTTRTIASLTDVYNAKAHPRRPVQRGTRRRAAIHGGPTRWETP